MISMTVVMIASFDVGSEHFRAVVRRPLIILSSFAPWTVGSIFSVLWFVASAYDFVFVDVDGSCATGFCVGWCFCSLKILLDCIFRTLVWAVFPSENSV